MKKNWNTPNNNYCLFTVKNNIVHRINSVYKPKNRHIGKGLQNPHPQSESG